MTKNEKILKRALRTLVNMYVKNQDSKWEFICCITPGKKTKSCRYWTAWTKAKELSKAKEELK